MNNKFIIDKEINLNENDFLNTKIYANNLSEIINNIEPNKVFTIGLFGNWGTGKSSIIKTSQSDFDENKIKFITYDAWQYVNDSFRRMFLRTLRKELNYDESDDMKKFYENESRDIGETYKFNWKNIPISIIILSILFILCIVIIQFVGLSSWKTGLTLSAIVSFVSLLVTIFQGLVHKLKISVTKPHLFAPEQFEDCYNEIIEQALTKQSLTKKITKWINFNNKSIQGLDKLVVVIDNMDRCSNEIAYNLLTDIKTFLGNRNLSVIFVIPVDDEALKKHIIQNSKNSNGSNEKEEFLRKFFNVTIRIKPYEEADMYSFAKKICEKYNLNFKPETINISSKEYAKNPRRIIQLFNNLLAELNYYDKDFKEKNETLICCILIIREEYSDYYKEIVNSPKLLTETYSGDKDDIKRFIRISKTALEKVEISDIKHILTNSYHQFDNLAQDIKDAIETFDENNVIKNWNNEKENISDFIIDKLNFSINNKLIDSDLIRYFDLCTKINLKYPLSKDFSKRIDEKILPFITNIITGTQDYPALCDYALLRETQKDKSIKDNMINDCVRNEEQLKNPYWQSLFNAVVQKFTDKNTSIKLSSTFTKYNNLNINTLQKLQIEYLVSNQYVQDRISELPIHEDSRIVIDTNTEQYQTIKWLFENKPNIASETFEHLFKLIIGENGEQIFNGKTKDEIADFIKFINPLLSLIPNKKLNKQPQMFYNLIVNNRDVPNPSYRANSYPAQKQLISKNFIDECISENTYIDEIIKFVFNIYRISANNTNTQTEINKLIQHHNLNNDFTKLINMGFSLSPIINIVFDHNTDFSKDDTLALLEHSFNQKNGETYIIDKTNAISKLESILTYALENNDSKSYALLENLLTQKYYSEIISSIITQKDSSFINSLSPKLLKQAVNSFSKDTYLNYSENFEFLSAILTNGNNNQKGYVVRIITENLTNNKNIDKSLGLIDIMKDISSFDKSGLLYSHLDNYQRENKDAISKELNEQIEQLKKKMAKA